MGDVYANAHKAREQAARREQVKAELERRKAAAAKQMIDKMKPVFNDLPQYKFRDVFKYG